MACVPCLCHPCQATDQLHAELFRFEVQKLKPGHHFALLIVCFWLCVGVPSLRALNLAAADNRPDHHLSIPEVNKPAGRLSTPTKALGSLEFLGSR